MNPHFRVSRIPASPRRRWTPARLGMALLAMGAMLLLGAGLWLALPERSVPPVQAVHEESPAMTLKREAGRLWAAGARAQALTVWAEAHRLRPENRDITASLAHAHVAISSDFLRANDPEAALPHLEAAHRLMPREAAVLHEYQALRAYLVGRDALNVQNWSLALEALEPLYFLDPRYLDVGELLSIAVAGQRQAQVATEARQARHLSQARLAEPGRTMQQALAPRTISSQPGQSQMPSLGPLAARDDKHIVVSINAQRMYVYENGKLRWNWTASTGESERPTIPGRYRIQSKHTNARSEVWSLWMPYWQGIYWAGSVENGIHGQVTFDAGGRLWEGYLGTRITFGCVMISDANAATLYEWTEMGTPVSIHWEWNPAWVPDANGDPK